MTQITEQKQWEKENKYLQDKYWQEGPNHKFLPLVNLPNPDYGLNPNTEIIYDFEAQHNIYSLSALYLQDKKLIIWYYTDSSVTINPKIVKARAKAINGRTIKNYNQTLNGLTPDDIEVRQLTPNAIRGMFERPKQYVVGFNSNYYDLYIASYILSMIYFQHAMPLPSALRQWNNLLITPIPTIRSNEIYQEELHKDFNINTYSIRELKKLRNYQLAQIFDYVPKWKQHLYPNEKNGTQTDFHGTVPYINTIYRQSQNTGKQLDMKLLNEKDDDPSTRYTSLKRIAAQMGFQIEEPEAVNLSSNGDLSNQECVNLLAYNASDVLVTTLIYKSADYQDVLSNRQGLLNRFDKTNFLGKLNTDTTSAKFVENVIVPNKAIIKNGQLYVDNNNEASLRDQKYISLFYPVHGPNPKITEWQKKINQDFINKTVPKINYDDRTKWFVTWCTRLPDQDKKTLKKEYDNYTEKVQKLDYQYYVKQFNEENENSKKKLLDYDSWKNLNSSNTLSKNDWLINNQYDKGVDSKYRLKFEKWLKPWLLKNYHHLDLDYLDIKWTKALRDSGEKWTQDNTYLGKTHHTVQVKYGEIQQDLLEYAIMHFKKFPSEVYKLYDCYRGQFSDVDQNGNIIKTARDKGTELFVHRYALGDKPKTKKQIEQHLPAKKIAPRNVHFKYRQKDNKLTGVGVIVQVPGEPMCLSFSVGGVHGEVIKQKPFERDTKLTDTFNNVLKVIKNNYPDPSNYLLDAKNGTLKAPVKKLLNLDDETFNKDIKAFICHRKGVLKYQEYKEAPNPKEYVIPIDMHNAVHVDVDSLYPSMMINLHFFSKWEPVYQNPKYFDKTNKAGHWYDLYKKLRAERVRLKKTALKVPKENWGHLQRHQWAIQLIDKLLLNSASGIADGKWKTKVRMNNRAASMRIIGQLALTYLVYRVEPKGVYSTSTNTDGVYLTSKNPKFTINDISEEIEEWKKRHHLGATPEIMSHFVSKDANNRFEQGDPEEQGNPAGGVIGNANMMPTKDNVPFGASTKKKMSQPFIIDAAIVNYFKTHKNVCRTYDLPYQDIYDYIASKRDEIINAKEYNNRIRQIMLSFCWPIQPNKNQRFIFKHPNDNLSMFAPAQHVNRVLLVKHGFEVIGYEIQKENKSNRKNLDEDLTTYCRQNGMIENTDLARHAFRVKISNFNPKWQVLRVNLDLSFYFKSPIWQNLDIDAYTHFTENRILGTTGKPIWVEKKFKVPAFAKKLNRILHQKVAI